MSTLIFLTGCLSSSSAAAEEEEEDDDDDDDDDDDGKFNKDEDKLDDNGTRDNKVGTVERASIVEIT